MLGNESRRACDKNFNSITTLKRTAAVIKDTAS
jgi:hypothetical protein